MIHLDIKKLGRFVRTGHRITGDRTGQWSVSLPNQGRAYLHVRIDSAACSRRGSTTCIHAGGRLAYRLYRPRRLVPDAALPRLG